jgi:hypothetical protein
MRRALVAVFLIGCGGGGGDDATDAGHDTRIVSTVPANGDAKVSVLVDPTITLDGTLRAASVDATTVTLREVGRHAALPAAIDYSGDTITVRTPLALSHGTTYELTLDGLVDDRGRALDATHVQFTTYANPLVREVGYSGGEIAQWTAYGDDVVTVYTGIGTDGDWFTHDDVIDEMDRDTRDNLGHVVQHVTYVGPGTNGTWGNDDDDIEGWTAIEYDTAGQVVREIHYNGPGDDGIWLDGNDRVLDYQERDRPDADGRYTRQTRYSDPGANGTWIDDDDVPSFHVDRTEDDAGRTVADAQYDGPGLDGIWRNGDDHVAIAYVSEYDADGNLTRFRRQSGAGNDRVWNTDDDPITGYDRVDSQAGVRTRTVSFSDVGLDGMWFSPDDDVSFYDNVDQPFHKDLVAREGAFGGPGDNGIWFTEDDAVVSRTTRAFDAAGNVDTLGQYISPGLDGDWYTNDDVPAYVATYDTTK